MNFALLFSCQHYSSLFLIRVKKEGIIVKSKLGKSRSFKIDTVSVESDSLSMNPYYVYDTFKDKDDFFIGYNENIHALDFFNLPKKIQTKRIYLSSEGMGAINELLSFDVYNLDSIFLHARTQLRIINSMGINIAKYNLISDTIFESFGEPVSDFYFKLQYLEDRKSILFYNVIDPPSLRSEKK